MCFEAVFNLNGLILPSLSWLWANQAAQDLPILCPGHLSLTFTSVQQLCFHQAEPYRSHFSLTFTVFTVHSNKHKKPKRGRQTKRQTEDIVVRFSETKQTNGPLNKGMPCVAGRSASGLEVKRTA